MSFYPLPTLLLYQPWLCLPSRSMNLLWGLFVFSLVQYFHCFSFYISEFDNALEQILSLRRPQPTVFCGYVASPVSLLRKSCSIIVTYNKFYADLLALPCCSIRGRRLCLHTLVVSHVGLCCICFLLFVLGFFWKLSGLHFGSKAWVGLFWWQCSDSSALVLSTPCPGSAFPTSSPSSLV